MWRISQWRLLLVLVLVLVLTGLPRSAIAGNVALLHPAGCRDLADVLTAKLSSEPGLVVLEREQLQRIFSEKHLQLSQAVAEPVQTGALLGAEALLVLDSLVRTPQGFSVPLRVIWAERGIVVYEELVAVDQVPVIALPELRSAFRKIGELREAGTDAVAIDLVGIFVDGGGQHDLCAQLAALFSRRLQREKGWAVLERRRLVEAAFEKELAPVTRKPLTTATDRATIGISRDKERLLFRVHLENAKRPPADFRFEGSDQDPAQLAEAFFSALLAAMNRKPGAADSSWDALKEAAILLRQANEICAKEQDSNGAVRPPYQSVYELASAAWALGLRTSEVSDLRIFALIEMAQPHDPQRDAWLDFSYSNYIDSYSANRLREMPNAVRVMTAAARLTRDHWKMFPDIKRPVRRYSADELTLYFGGQLLKMLCDDALETAFVEDLPELRTELRALADAMPDAKLHAHKRWLTPYLSAVAFYCSLWEEDYSAATERIWKALNHPTLEAVPYAIRSMYMEVLTSRRAGEYERKIARTFFSPRNKTEPDQCRAAELALARRLVDLTMADRAGLAGELNSLGRDIFRSLGMEEEAWRGLKSREPIAGPKPLLEALKESGPGKLLPIQFFRQNELRDNGGRSWSQDEFPLLATALEQYRQRIENITSREAFEEAGCDPWHSSTPYYRAEEYFGQLVRAQEFFRAGSGAFSPYSQEKPVPAADSRPNFKVGRFWFPETPSWSPGLTHFQTQLVVGSHGLYLSNLIAARRNSPEVRPGIWQIDLGKADMNPLEVPPGLNTSGQFSARGVDDKLVAWCGNQIYCGAFAADWCHCQLPLNSIIRLEVLGSIDATIYFSVEAVFDNSAEVSVRLYRWNLRDRPPVVVADSARYPLVSRLDELIGRHHEHCFELFETAAGTARLLVYEHDDRKPQNERELGTSVFEISPKSAEPVLLQRFEPGAAIPVQFRSPSDPHRLRWVGFSQQYDARSKQRELSCLPVSRFGSPGAWIWTAPEKARKLWKGPRVDKLELTARFPAQVLGVAYDAPRNNSGYASFRPGANPCVWNSAVGFELDGVVGCLVIERDTGRELRSRGWLGFFEPGGLKAVALAFEIPAWQLKRLRPHLEITRKVKVARDWSPQPDISDQAYVLEDKILLTDRNADGLWWITREELKAARKLAR